MLLLLNAGIFYLMSKVMSFTLINLDVTLLRGGIRIIMFIFLLMLDSGVIYGDTVQFTY
jgi:hypothetical protein